MTRDKIHLQAPAEKLTGRELEVIALTAYGKTRAEISIILSISEETVKSYLERACVKLNAVNKTQAVTIALTLGLIEPFEFVDVQNKQSVTDRHSSSVPQTGNIPQTDSPLSPLASSDNAEKLDK